MELVDYLRIAVRRWYVIALSGLFAVVAVYVTTPAVPASRPLDGTGASSYRASQVLVQRPSAEHTQLGLPPPNLKIITLYAQGPHVPKRVADKLGPGVADAETVAARVTATLDAEIGGLRLSAGGGEPEQVRRLVELFATELVAYADEVERARYEKVVAGVVAQVRELEARVGEVERRLASGPDSSLVRAERDALVRQYGAAVTRHQELAVLGPPRSGLESVQPAAAVTADGERFVPPQSRGGRLPIVGALALAVGAALALLIDRLDPRLRDRPSTQEAFRLPVLAEIPRLGRRARRRLEVVTFTRPASASAEAYRMARTALLLMAPADGRPARAAERFGGPPRGAGQPQVVLVTAGHAGEGCTTTVANLAASFAESGRSVFVLSSDRARPRIHRLLGLAEGESVTDVIEWPDGMRLVGRRTAIPGVRLLTASREAQTAALALSPRVVEEARRRADVVVVDAGPLLTTSDAGELMPSTDAVVVVARVGKTTAEAAIRTRELLERFAAPTVGVVLVGAGSTARSLLSLVPSRVPVDSTARPTASRSTVTGRERRRERRP